MKRSIRLLGAGIAVLLSLAACASVGGQSGSGGGNGSSVINLGLVYEGGGGLNAINVAYLHGLQIAVRNVNASGGIKVGGKKYTFALDTCNDFFDQTQTTGCADKLALDHHDLFMFGGFADFGPIIRGVTEPHHVIYFSTGPAVAALMNKSHYVVDVVPTNEIRAKADVMAIQKLYPNAKTVAFLGDQALVWTQDVQAITAAMKGTGLKVVASEVAPLSMTNFSSLLTNIKSSHPDVLISFMTSPARSEAILQENAQLHVVNQFFDPSATCQAISAGATPGIAVSANTNTGAIVSGPNVTPLVKKYTAQYYVGGYQPNPDPNLDVALYSYDDVAWLKDAMEKAGTTTDVTSILKAMNSITYHGLNGTITMSDNQETYGQVICYSDNGAAPFQEMLLRP